MCTVAAQMASARNAATLHGLNEEAKESLLQELKETIVRVEQELLPTFLGERRRRPDVAFPPQ